MVALIYYMIDACIRIRCPSILNFCAPKLSAIDSGFVVLFDVPDEHDIGFCGVNVMNVHIIL